MNSNEFLENLKQDLKRVGITQVIDVGVKHEAGVIWAKVQYVSPDPSQGINEIEVQVTEIHLKNKGRYPAYVERIELVLRSKERIPFIDTHGRKIGDPLEVSNGQPVKLFFVLVKHLPEIKTPKAIRCIEVVDDQGKVHRYPRWGKTRRQWGKRIKQEWTPEQEAYWEQQPKR